MSTLLGGSAHSSRSAEPIPSGTQEFRSFLAPARVNLLGEHTDYSGGLVLPMAIPFYTKAVLSAAATGYTFESDLFDTVRTAQPGEQSTRAKLWSDYPLGVLVELQKLGCEPPAFHLQLSGDVPLGAGLSSSASVEVACCLAMLAWQRKTMSAAEVALLCQRAENQFVGSPCGIMDQFVITAARANHALLIHTQNLTFELVPLNRGDMRETCIVVFNSMVKHSIAEGGYGDRRKEVEAGQMVLRERVAGVQSLGEATLSDLNACTPYMSQESFRRCRHIITENERVRLVRQALWNGEAARVGELMVAAHASQRDDFECSCAETDFLVDAATEISGCFGARMTGGGFGGCTVNLVQRSSAESFANTLKEQYQQRFGVEAETYLCEAVSGAMALNPSVEVTD